MDSDLQTLVIVRSMKGILTLIATKYHFLVGPVDSDLI